MSYQFIKVSHWLMGHSQVGIVEDIAIMNYWFRVIMYWHFTQKNRGSCIKMTAQRRFIFRRFMLDG